MRAAQANGAACTRERGERCGLAGGAAGYAGAHRTHATHLSCAAALVVLNIDGRAAQAMITEEKTTRARHPYRRGAAPQQEFYDGALPTSASSVCARACC